MSKIFVAFSEYLNFTVKNCLMTVWWLPDNCNFNMDNFTTGKGREKKNKNINDATFGPSDFFYAYFESFWLFSDFIQKNGRQSRNI